MGTLAPSPRSHTKLTSPPSPLVATVAAGSGDGIPAAPVERNCSLETPANGSYGDPCFLPTYFVPSSGVGTWGAIGQ